MAGRVSVGEVVARYLAAAPEEGRRQAQQELQRFLLWCGRDRAIDALTSRDISRYVEQEERRGGGDAAQMEPLRLFFASLAKQRMTTEDLSKAIRVRRASAPRPAPNAAQRSGGRSARLTMEGHAGLQAELASLLAERPRVADELRKAASDGDISENAPLDAMRDHQGQLEARIRELEALLSTARVVEGGTGLAIGLGSTVVLRNVETGEILRCFLVDPAEANPREGKLSVTSPLGRTLLGRDVGEEVEVAAPAGTWRYRIEPA